MDMGNAMRCPKCGMDIRPGDRVSILTLDGIDDDALIVTGDMIFSHVECPSPELVG